jgi:hypothetical protein
MSAARPTRRGAGSVVAALVALTLAGCAGDDGATSSSATSPTSASSSSSAGASPAQSGAPEPLPLGKDDLAVSAGEHSSPEGFAPAVTLKVPTGWTSVHRGADAFDLGLPDPDVDAPLLAVVFMTPPEGSARAALDAVTSRVRDSTAPVRSRIGAIPATSVDLTGGKGQVVASRDGGIALDAGPGQRMRVYAADVGGAPLLVVVLVPDGRRWRAAIPRAEALLAGTTAS